MTDAEGLLDKARAYIAECHGRIADLEDFIRRSATRLEQTSIGKRAIAELANEMRAMANKGWVPTPEPEKPAPGEVEQVSVNFTDPLTGETSTATFELTRPKREPTFVTITEVSRPAPKVETVVVEITDAE